MKITSTVIIALSLGAFATNSEASNFDVDSFLNKTKIRIGISYKYKEVDIVLRDRKSRERVDASPYGARIGIYYQYSKRLTIGVDHHSQWISGWPINDNGEYGKTELFVDYTFSLGDLIK